MVERGKCVSLALILLIFVTSSLLGGCEKTKVPVPEQNIVEEKVQTGGELVVGSAQEPDTLNPILAKSVAASEVANLLFDGLVKINSQMRWIPDLAEEVPTIENGGVSPDGTEVTYKLRKDVKWHDGEPFTANDVVFTYRAIMNEKNKVTPREGYDKIVSVEALDSHTVKVVYREPYPGYLLNFPYIIPKHILEGEKDLAKADFNIAPVGTGPFRFKEWEKGKYLLFEANPDYFLGQPHLDRIRYTLVFNTNALIMKLRTGEVDMVNRVPEDQLSKLQNVKNIKSYVEPNLIWEHLELNLNNKLFQDVRVRQAIAYGIDPQAIVDEVLNGAGVVTPGSLPPQSWAYHSQLKPYSRNVEKAKELLSAAGWEDVDNDGILEKNGRKLSFTCSTTAGDVKREKIQQMIRDQLHEIGVEMVIENYEPNLLFPDILFGRRFDSIIFSWVLNPDPDQWELWHSSALPPKGKNFTGYSNPEMDILLDEARSTLNFSERKQAYLKMQELLKKDVPVVPLYFKANVTFAKAQLVNFKPNPTNQTNFWNAHEWWIKR